MESEAVIEVIEKLVGNINPAGATHIDEKRFENLQVMCLIVDDLLDKIEKVATDNKDRQEFSMKEMGNFAQKFLTSIR